MTDVDLAGGSGGMDGLAALFEQSVAGGDFAREGELIACTVVDSGKSGSTHDTQDELVRRALAPPHSRRPRASH